MDETGIVLPVAQASTRTTAPRQPGRVAGWMLCRALAPPWTPYVWLAALLAAVVWPVWTSTQELAVGGDVLLIHYPWFVLWRQMLAAGQWPWWNAYTLGGMPAFATLQAGYGYPPHWLLSWLPAIQAVNWTVGLHIVLAGLGTAFRSRYRCPCGCCGVDGAGGSARARDLRDVVAAAVGYRRGDG